MKTDFSSAASTVLFILLVWTGCAMAFGAWALIIQ